MATRKSSSNETELPVEETESDAAELPGAGVADVPGDVPDTPDAPLAPPSHYIATAPLYQGGGFGMPVRAFNTGDQVPSDLVAVNGWTANVRHPDSPAPADTTDAEQAGQE